MRERKQASDHAHVAGDPVPSGVATRLARLVEAKAQLSRGTMRNIRQNLFFAFVYKALGVPLAAGVLYPVLGLLLSDRGQRGEVLGQGRLRWCGAAP